MKILSVKNPRYTKKLVLNDGTKIALPKPGAFGAFEKKHGCSLRNGVCIGLQFLKIRQSDGSLWNPKEIYAWAKKNVRGYTGSKLTIYGVAKVINGISHHTRAKWYPITTKNTANVIRSIKAALNDNCIVLFEQKNPIHTVAFMGYDKKGRLVIIDNGNIKRSSVRGQVRNKALRGKEKSSEQTNWFKSAEKAAGYVIVRRK